MSEICLSGDSHGQVNEFDTYKEAQLGLEIFSRISRFLKGILNVAASRPYSSDCQKPFAYISKDDKRAQSPKTIISNVNILQPRDLTASRYNTYLMRRRSFHSSAYTKESSRIPLLLDANDSNTKGTEELNLEKGSNSFTSVSSWAKTEISKYLRGDGTYNGLIRILADSKFLQACYLEIKSKPGNMSKGTDDTTLDGINLKWFDKTAASLLTGKYQFSPARRVMIPKPGKSEKRPLSVANPRDKVIQKAMTVMLEAI